MLKKIFFPIILILIGIAAIMGSVYIKNQVVEGRRQIAEGKEKLERGKGLFSLNPITKELGRGLEKQGQSKIKEGTRKADYYQSLSNWMLYGGIVFIVAGSVVLLIKRKKIN